MQIIKNRTIVEDNWQLLGMDEPLVNGNIIVPFKRWQTAREQLLTHNGSVGIKISAGQALSEVVESLAQFDVIALEFEKFSDGRGYSYARLLRERHHYTGEIRAVGDVLHDQLGYMARCGINSFMLCDGQDLQEALHAFDDFSIHYQAVTDNIEPIYYQRLNSTSLPQ